MTEPIEPVEEPKSSGNNTLAWVLGIVAIIVIVIVIVVLVSRDDDDDPDTASDGATPEEIAEGQEALAAVGCYTGAIDGIYGPGTDQAIRSFQEAKGLTVDGIFGPATLDALRDAVAADETVCTAPPPPEPDVPQVQLTTSDGLDTQLDVESCSLVGENGLELVAKTETADLTVSAADNQGSIVYNSSEGNREGRVEMVEAGDSEDFSATGTLTTADDSAEPANFELSGTCHNSS